MKKARNALASGIGSVTYAEPKTFIFCTLRRAGA